MFPDRSVTYVPGSYPLPPNTRMMQQALVASRLFERVALIRED
jgi:hypothetical protein